MHACAPGSQGGARDAGGASATGAVRERAEGDVGKARAAAARGRGERATGHGTAASASFGAFAHVRSCMRARRRPRIRRPQRSAPEAAGMLDSAIMSSNSRRFVSTAACTGAAIRSCPMQERPSSVMVQPALGRVQRWFGTALLGALRVRGDAATCVADPVGDTRGLGATCDGDGNIPRQRSHSGRVLSSPLRYDLAILVALALVALLSSRTSSTHRALSTLRQVLDLQHALV